MLLLQLRVHAFISQLLVKPPTVNWLHVNIVKYWGHIMAGMWSLLECDSLSWSVVDFRHWSEHCPATQPQFLSAAHIDMLNLVGDNTAWQRGFPFPATRCFALSVLDTQPLPPFQTLLPLWFCLIGGQWEWCLSGPVGDLTHRYAILHSWCFSHPGFKILQYLNFKLRYNISIYKR